MGIDRVLSTTESDNSNDNFFWVGDGNLNIRSYLKKYDFLLISMRWEWRNSTCHVVSTLP